MNEEETFPALNRKLYIEIKTSINISGNKFYSVHSDFGSSGSGCGRHSAQEVVDHIKGILAHPSNVKGDEVKLTPERVVLTNTTSIKINIPAMLAQLSGNSLMGFLEANVQAGGSLEYEAVTKDVLEDHNRMVAEDKFDKEVLNPMREKIHDMEIDARKFGLPERTGFSVWNKREKQAALKKFPHAKKVFDDLDKINAEFEKAYCRQYNFRRGWC